MRALVHSEIAISGGPTKRAHFCTRTTLRAEANEASVIWVSPQSLLCHHACGNKEVASKMRLERQTPVPSEG